MPYFSHRILVSLSPLVNLDLFKKGYYHVTCRLVDEQGSENYSRITCMGVKDLFGPELATFTYPGACVDEDRFVTQTVLMEYTDQSYPLGEWAVFSSEKPIIRDYTEAYVATYFTLVVELKYCAGEEAPEALSKFELVSTRSLSLRVDWRKGLHDHFPVIFDYFHMAALGVTIHASLIEILPDEFTVELPPIPQKKWLFQANPPARIAPQLPSLWSVLFGQPESKAAPLSVHPAVPSPSPPATNLLVADSPPMPKRAEQYVVPTHLLQRGQEAYRMLYDIMKCAQDSLFLGYAVMSGEAVGNGGNNVISPEIVERVGAATSLKEAEEICRQGLHEMNQHLASTWDWFCSSAVVHPDMISFLATRAHSLKLSYVKQTIVAPETAHYRLVTHIADPLCQSSVAHRVRQSLQNHIPFYCRENLETQMGSSVMFVEPCPWEARGDGRRCDTSPFSFLKHTQPYLLSVLPRLRKQHRRHNVHLIVCVHGLQGTQFDLRLYRIYLTLCLPNVKLDFLMAQSNQGQTFTDFNLMTNNLLSEVLDYVASMPTPPSKISFIGHSLGNIVVRSLVTRPEFAQFLPKLHLFFSICGPHLGTRLQNSIVSVGMWAVRKWFNSTSLLQLSLKDSPNPRDSFLYHLSEAPSMECFRHIVLLSSYQDKYVPYHSAKLASVSKDGSLQSTLSLEMMQNILEPLRERRVNLVRISVDHSIPTSTNSLIGRAAHIAMLDSEPFIEKIVMLHLTKYFVE